MQDQRPKSILREFLDGEAAGGIILMVTAALALIVANSPLAETYFAVLHAYLGPLSVSHWINDGLMAVFFLLVGLEIKREVLDGQLSTWPRRVLPGIAAAGGIVVPALVYVAINRLDGTLNLFGPAPGPAYDEEGERRWAAAANGPINPLELNALIEKLQRIDPDIWVVEIEDRSGTGGLSLARDS